MARRNSILFTAPLLVAFVGLAASAQQPLQQGRPLNVPQPQESGNWFTSRLPWAGKGGAGRPQQTASRPRSPREVSHEQKTAGQFAMGRLAERRDQTEAAVQVYEALIQRNPGMPGPYHRLGVIAAKQGDAARAEKMLLAARRLDPQNPDLLRDLGYLYYLNGQLPEAEAAYRQGLAAKRDHQALNNNYAMLLAERQRFKESLQLFKNVNEPAEAHANMGFMLAQLGYLDKAEQYFSHALTIDKDLKTAAHGLIETAKLKNHAGSSKAREDARRQVAQGGASAKPSEPAKPTKKKSSTRVATAALSDRATAPQASRIEAAAVGDSAGGEGEAIRTVSGQSSAADRQAADRQAADRQAADAADAVELKPLAIGQRSRGAVGVAPQKEPQPAAQPGPARKRNTLRIGSSRHELPAARQPREASAGAGEKSNGKAATEDASATPKVRFTLPGALSDHDWSTDRFPTSQSTWTPDMKKTPAAKVVE